MPYKNVQELENSGINGVDDLTEREKRIFLRVYNDMAYSGKPESEAIAGAFSQAKKKGRRGHNRTT